MLECEPGIARLLASNPSPYTATGTQVHLIGTRELAILDPGPDDPAHVAALLRAIDERPVAAILITHTHRDHSPAANPLRAATGAPVIGCTPLALEGLGEGAEAFDAAYAPDRVLNDGEFVEIDGRRMIALHTPGHTSNHLCFADEASGALFSGDHVMGWSTSVIIPPDGSMGDYLRSLDKLRGRSDRIYYPAHGEPVMDPQRLVRGMINHRLQRERQIVRRLEQGDRTIKEIVSAAYPALDPRLVPAAGASVWAHLVDLEQRGIVWEANGHWLLKQV
ncbi:MAG TPA: MBL fold metallo-hydrolase [Sphingomicrobium sp.]|nr:MBL fold metallo-hydrolase [Sphingomicrobium sp.]